MAIITGILLTASVTRHALFQSTAWDLGIFDQAVYLISRGLPPLSSYLGNHILADHAAFIFYGLALFYKLHPSVYWLLLMQALCLSSVLFPLYRLAQEIGVTDHQAQTICWLYGLYPLIFNVNLFDFHPDVIAFASVFWLVLGAYRHQWGQCLLTTLIIVSCKAVFSLWIVFIGLWLWVPGRWRWGGAGGMGIGIAWFILSSRWLIPLFGQNQANISRHVSRFSYLGSSYGEILQNLWQQPQLLFQGLFNPTNLGYLLLLFLPFIWGLHYRHLAPLIAALPFLALNLLSQDTAQKDLLHQYSLPILPFILIACLSAWAAGDAWKLRERYLLLWGAIAFVALAKYGYFGSRYLSALDSRNATLAAMELIPSTHSVLTTDYIAPHLSERQTIQLFSETMTLDQVAAFDSILINQQHPGLTLSSQYLKDLQTSLAKHPAYQQPRAQDGVFLFQRPAP